MREKLKTQGPRIDFSLISPFSIIKGNTWSDGKSSCVLCFLYPKKGSVRGLPENQRGLPRVCPGFAQGFAQRLARGVPAIYMVSTPLLRLPGLMSFQCYKTSLSWDEVNYLVVASA